MPTLSYSRVAPVGLSASTPSVTRDTSRASVSIGVVPDHGRDLVTVANEKPEGRIEVGSALPLLPPALEADRVMLPVILERRVERLVERARVFGSKCLEREPIRQRRRCGRSVELDRHRVEAADEREAVPGAEIRSGSIRLEDERVHARRAAIA